MEESAEQRTIAVVEDNPRIRELLEEEILDEGHQVLTFSSAEEFLAALESKPAIDLVLLDLMLPGMDGLSCLERIRSSKQAEHNVRVVIVTALNDGEKRRQAMALGAEDYILKPDLFMRLAEILQAPLPS
jgi:two-component system OmpR family response regulator|tara:strand:+ start:148 stop:537 length:390 start_codon:yes stop_codon:yes gene_type:complete